MMTMTQVLTSPLSVMDKNELQYVIATCDNEMRRAVEWGPTMEKYERRYQEARQELARR